MPAELLRASRIAKRFGGVRALREAEFSLVGGEVHALMGENGAGKSTLAKIMAGVLQPDSGQIFWEGNAVKIDGPLRAQQLGISIIHQELDLFPSLSVAENVAIGNRELADHALVNFNRLHRFAERFMQEAGLNVQPERSVSSLNIGDKQLVMIARALSMRARVIIMDEPTSSLFHDSVERLFRLIAELKGRGVSIIYVSHKMDELFRICDRMTVMRDGETIGTKVREETTRAELIGMMVGRPWTASERKTPPANTERLLSVSGLTTRKLVDVTFELAKGEVLGVAGLVGAGRSSLGVALAGLEKWQCGVMTLYDEKVAPRSVGEARKLGICLLPEDRKLEGLMMDMSVLENGTISDLGRFAFHGLIQSDREQRALQPLLSQLAFRSGSLGAPVSTLSGGNQQKILAARSLLGHPQVLFLDDPTRGIDVSAKEDIYLIIEKLSQEGRGVIFVSSELPELFRCCHRILVMREGRIAASLVTGETSPKEILAFATSGLAADAGGVTWPN